ncbi:MAG: thiamine phosphate synthase [Bacteroidales bacterium]|nr:thiamine phosphate synthase [Bacteroidales bacterium]
MDRIYFITHQNEKYSYLESAKLALDNGIRLIQLRMKNKPLSEIKQTAYVLKEECEKYKAKLIINDNSELAFEIGADGVHLGQKDEAISLARNVLKPFQIIGRTCNTKEQILQAYETKADYIGLGPYRFTSTKENLSPILGIEGYKNINLDIPIYAIGGIRLEDAKQLSETGVYGIAISSLILESKEPEKIIKELRKYFKEII